jgi:hypothetical protein
MCDFKNRTFAKLASFGYDVVEGGDFYEKRETILVPGRLRAPVGNRGDEPLPKLSDPNREAHGGCERPAAQAAESAHKKNQTLTNKEKRLRLN